MRLALIMAEASPWCRELAHRLSSAGVDVHVIDFQTGIGGAGYLTTGDPFQRREIELLRGAVAGVHHLRPVGRGQLRYLAAAPQLARICRRTGCDMVLTLYGGGNALMAYASRVRPYAVYAVGSDVLFMDSPVRRMLAARTLEGAAQVFANGEYLADRTRALAPEARVRPLLLGIDPRELRVRPRANARLEIVCTRGFMPVYANEVIVEAVSRMNDAPDFRLTFTSVGPELDRVRSLAGGSVDSGRVRFLGGVAREELIGLLESADVYVSMARSDGTSISLLEAMAAGAFPVVTDLPQNREWITPAASNGMLVPVDSAPALAETLRRTLADAAVRQRATAHNRALVEQRADAHTNTMTLINELEHVAHGRARAA